MKTLLLLLLSFAAYGQVTINAPAIQLDATGAAAVRTWMLGQTKGAETSLASPAAIDATSITVTSGQGINVGTVLIVGSEMLDVTAKAGPVLTVTRGYNGTTAGAYPSNESVKEAKYKTFNNLGKQIVVDTLKQITWQSVLVTAPVTSAQATAAAAVETAVQ